jgi:fructokinase
VSSRFLVVGEALIDEIDDGVRRDARPGGSPANVAVGLARLGNETTLVTRLGDDAYGRQVGGHLTGNEVRLSSGAVDAAPTSVATARLDAAGVATYAFSIVWDLPAGSIPAHGADCLHTGSLGAHLAPGAAVVAEALRAARGIATVSYDPNCRPSLMGEADDVRRDVEGLVALSDVVKASSEDVEWLYGEQAPLDVARRWLALGPALVVVTLGGAGASAVAACGVVEAPAPAVEVVDTVGAGDSFMSGLLDGLGRHGLLGPAAADRLRSISRDTLADVVNRGVVTSALTCQRAGADPPTADMLEAALAG